MPRILVVKSFEQGPRCWLFEQRVHHGATCFILTVVLLAAKKPRLAILALAGCVHDIHDLKVWFVREALDKIDVEA